MRVTFFENSGLILFFVAIFMFSALAVGYSSPIRDFGILILILSGFLLLVRILLATSETLNYFHSKTRNTIKSSVMIGTLVVCLSFGGGYQNAVIDVNQSDSRLFFTQTANDPVILLRAINRGYFVKDVKTHSVFFLGPDGEKIARYQIKIRDKWSYLCRWLNFKCDQFSSNLPKDAAP